MNIVYEKTEIRLDTLWSGACFLVGKKAYILTDNASEDMGTREVVCLDDGRVLWWAGDSMVIPVKSKVVIEGQL